MYLDDFIAVWQRMAEEHPKVKTFIRANENELSDILKNVAAYPVLMLGDYDGVVKPTVGKSRYIDYMKVAIYLLDEIPRGDYDTEQQKLNELKKIGLQIMSRLIYNKDEICPNYFIKLDTDGIEYTLTDFLYNNARGWVFEFTASQTSEAMEYNPQDWIVE